MKAKRSFSDSSGRKKPAQGQIDNFVADAAEGRKDAVKQFCQKYPDYVDAPDQDGQTALGAAAEKNQVDTGNVLLFAGASPNAFAKNEASPFLIWVMTTRPLREQKDTRLLESMIMHNADVNVRQGGTGMTGLMFYSVYANEKLCDYLLKNGMDPTVKDRDGLLARDHANKMSDQLGAELSYDEDTYATVRAEIDRNALKLEKAEKEWAQRKPSIKKLAAEAAKNTKLLS